MIKDNNIQNMIKKYGSDISFYTSVLEALPTPIVYRDIEGTLIYCNKAFAEFVAIEKEHLIGTTIYDVLPKEFADTYNELNNKIIKEKKIDYSMEESVKLGNIEKTLMVYRIPQLHDNGEVIGIIGILQDITEQIIARRRSRLISSIREAFWKMNHSVMDFDTDKEFFIAILKELNEVIDYFSHASVFKVENNDLLVPLGTYGYDEENILTYTIELRNSFAWKASEGKLNIPFIVENVDDYPTKGSPVFLPSEDGSIIVSSLVIPIYMKDRLDWIIFFDSNESGTFDDVDLDGALFLQEEIPIFYKLYNLTKKNLNMSRYDELTQLVNRNYFQVLFDDRLSLSDRSEMNLIVMYFDLDGLKQINDRYGHKLGDQYIKSFADLLINNFRKSDVFSRFGGDEFVGLILTNDLEGLVEKINSLQIEFELQDICLDGDKCKGSFSYGYAIYPSDSLSKEELMHIADKMMYENKKSKRAKK